MPSAALFEKNVSMIGLKKAAMLGGPSALHGEQKYEDDNGRRQDVRGEDRR